MDKEKLVKLAMNCVRTTLQSAPEGYPFYKRGAYNRVKSYCSGPVIGQIVSEAVQRLIDAGEIKRVTNRVLYPEDHPLDVVEFQGAKKVK